jgi:hypothetical protein
MKILISSIYHPSKDYCRIDMLKYLYSLGQDVYIVDNSNITYGEKDAVKKSREKIRLKAIEEGYDYILFTDFDTIGDENTLNKLLEVNQDVVSGVYFSRKLDCQNYPMAWRDEMTMDERLELFRNDTGIYEIHGAGLGCCLIKTEVIKNISFMDWKQPDDDYPLFDRIRGKNDSFKCDLRRVYLQTGVQCRHQINENTYVLQGNIIINK